MNSVQTNSYQHVCIDVGGKTLVTAMRDILSRVDSISVAVALVEVDIGVIKPET